MTRLTINVTGDPLTFRPVTSSIVRQSRTGNVNVVIMLFGTHYNIKMDGILQLDNTGDVETSTLSLAVANSLVNLSMERESGGTGIPTQIATFSSFMYFYVGLKIIGHLKLDETSHAPTVPALEAHYHFKDLLSEDELIFRLIRNEFNLLFEMVEIVAGVEKIIYSENLAVGVDEIYFQFVHLEQGKSKLFTFEDYAKLTQVKTRKWIGNTNAKIGECNVSLHHHNEEETLHTASSDLIFMQYPEIFLKFDRESTDRFIGHIQMYDDNNTEVEVDWNEIRSRDYKFTGNRVIENGMIRIIIKTDNPVIEVYGWNYKAVFPAWEKTMEIIPESDSGVNSLKIQDIKFEYFNKNQLKGEINFGSSFYSFIISRGDPYITMVNKEKLSFRFKTELDHFIGDFANEVNSYTPKNSNLSGNPLFEFASGTVVLATVLAGDDLVVNGLNYAAVAGVKADNTEFSIDGSDTVDAADLADSINNDTRVPVTVSNIDVRATSLTDTVTIIAKARGPPGNDIDMSDNAGSRITPSGTFLTGGAISGGTGTESLTNYVLEDNWFGVYQSSIGGKDTVVGWVSNIINPTQIDVSYNFPDFSWLFTYPRIGNVIAVGVLPSDPSSLVGLVPSPFVVGTQDEYVKWRANEAVLAFKQVETIKRR